MAFQEYKPNIENLQQYMEKEKEKKSGDNTNWWSLPSGMSSIRILPPWDPTGRVALPVFMHPIEYKGEGMNFTKYNWTCVNKTFGKPCPICEGLATLAAAGIDISNWEASRRQFYFNAIVMHDPTYNAQKNEGTAPGTHVLMRAPKVLYDFVIANITNPMIGDITSVSNGIDLFVTKEGSGLGTKYTPTLSPNGRTAIPQEYLNKITDLYNLDDVFGAGFDQEQINELVNHLKKSAGVMSNSIPQIQQQMAGYPQASPMQSTGYPQMNNPVAAPNQYQQQMPSMPQMMPNQFTAPSSGMPTMAPNQFNTGTPVNFPQAGNPIPTMSQTTSPSNPQPANNGGSSDSNLPKCFGQYDNGAVNCVVCPHEISCSQSKK